MSVEIIRVKRNRVKLLESTPNKNEHTTLIDKLIVRTKSYYHYGVYISPDTIIHFVGPSYLRRKESRIEKISLREFLRGGELEIVDSYNKAFSDQEIKERVFSKLGTNFGIYSIIENNCEHFATWCVTGKRQSEQSKLLERSKKAVKLPLKPIRVLQESGVIK